MSTLHAKLKEQVWIFDGAMGTLLQNAGLTPAMCPERWNIDHPTEIMKVHQAYVEAGANIIETNTFGANRIKLQHYGLADQVTVLNEAAVKLAKQVAQDKALVAGSVGPTGKFIAPIGDLTFDEAYNVFYEQITALATAGAHLIVIETMADIQEMRAALLACKACCNLPVICQLTYEHNMRTLTGTDPLTAATILEGLGADAIGANCSGGPAELYEVAVAYCRASTLPISIQANAGMPQLENGMTVYRETPEAMASYAQKMLDAGVTIFGGCCGTTPSHIKAISEALIGQAVTKRDIPSATKLASRTQTVFLGPHYPTAVIGERINPTGRKVVREELSRGILTTVKKDALEQVQAGAVILDINMGAPNVDETTLMSQAVRELQQIVNVPFAIDTTRPDAMEEGLKLFPGKALLNSVTAEPHRLEQMLPLAKKYGAAVLGLPLTEQGVPRRAEERVAAAQKIIDAALSHGIPIHNILLDGLVLTAAAEQEIVQETLKTLLLYRSQFGVATVLGLSNVSFGLPRRDLLNANFLAMALACGLDAPILNPYDSMIQDTLHCSAVLLHKDKQASRYIQKYGVTQVAATPVATTSEQSILEQITASVITGDKEAVCPLVATALQSLPVMDIIEQGLVKGMSDIGSRYNQGTAFLPQVMRSAETMRAAFGQLKELLPSDQRQKTATVILATVQGDIHDLGKNIVGALLENYGFTVIDLGKDVSAQAIVAAAQTHKAEIVGLSALMTTTMTEMPIVIQQLQQAGLTSKVIVGGAVVTEDYAQIIGADAYAKDGLDAVAKAQKLIASKQ